MAAACCNRLWSVWVSPAGLGELTQSVVDEIVAMGGEAIANGADIADWEQAKGLVDAAVEGLL